MELAYDDRDGVRTIRLKGRMDLDGASAIDLKFASLTVTQQAFIVVDLSEVVFMASMGLATLVRNARAVRLRRGNMVLFNPPPAVYQVLKATRIDEVLPVYSDLDEARLAAATPPPTNR
jgi:anti-sigma B factor antagonist